MRTAHTGMCVGDLDAAVAWYSEVLGLRVLSPPYEMRGAAIERDVGELVPHPVVVRAAIVGGDGDDHVIELLEYPEARRTPHARELVDHGISHVGVVCDDVVTTRAALEGRGVRFLTSGVAQVAGLRTTWCSDPWGNVIILMSKRDPDRPYWQQFG